MNAKRLLSLWGLKWNPFSPELPSDGLLVTAPIENFAWRVEQLVQEGGFALICGESGSGKSVALRIVAERLATLREVVVGVLERPQSRPADFYRELGDVFSVKLTPWNRWGGFKALRERWRAHVTSSRIKPLLLVDEAQEMSVEVLNELRILSSADFDARSLLTVVLCRRRPACGTLAASRPGPAGNADPHAADHGSRIARGTLRTPRATRWPRPATRRS